MCHYYLFERFMVLKLVVFFMLLFFVNGNNALSEAKYPPNIDPVLTEGSEQYHVKAYWYPNNFVYLNATTVPQLEGVSGRILATQKGLVFLSKIKGESDKYRPALKAMYSDIDYIEESTFLGTKIIRVRINGTPHSFQIGPWGKVSGNMSGKNEFIKFIVSGINTAIKPITKLPKIDYSVSAIHKIETERQQIAVETAPDKEQYIQLEDMPELKILKGKIEFDDMKSPDFSILSLNRRPTLTEKKALLKWGRLRESRAEEFLSGFILRPDQVRVWADQWWYDLKVLTADLSLGKLTYSDYAKKKVNLFSYYDNKMREYEQTLLLQQQQIQNARIEQVNYQAQQASIVAEQARLEKQIKRDAAISALQNLSNQLQQQEAQNNEIRSQRLRDAQRSFNEMQMLRIQQQRNNIIQGW